MSSRKGKIALQLEESDESGLVAETTSLLKDVSSDSSTYNTVGIRSGNNVSFVNINYTIQPKSFLARFKEIPPKIILENVR